MRAGTAPSGSDSGAEWSGYQAVKHIRYGPDWKKDVVSPNWKFITDVRGGIAGELHVDHPRLRRLRSHELRRRLRALVGRGTRQCRRSEQVLGLHRDLRHLGRLGRPLRPRAAAVRGLRRTRFPRSVHHRLAVRQARSTFRTSSTKPRACCVLPRTCSVSVSSPPPTSARNSPAGDCFDFQQKPLPFVTIAAPKPPRFFMQHLPDDYFAPDYD